MKDTGKSKEVKPFSLETKDEKPSFFKDIEVEISFFESFVLLVSMLTILEVGFFHTTIACMVLATVAFYEMTQLQENRAKEDRIIVKSSYVDWSFYLSF